MGTGYQCIFCELLGHTFLSIFVGLLRRDAFKAVEKCNFKVSDVGRIGTGSHAWELPDLALGFFKGDFGAHNADPCFVSLPASLGCWLVATPTWVQSNLEVIQSSKN